jgi:hypothetical protein
MKRTMPRKSLKMTIPKVLSKVSEISIGKRLLV